MKFIELVLAVALLLPLSSFAQSQTGEKAAVKRPSSAKELVEQAYRGDAHSQVLVGLSFQNGEQPDHAQAVDWFRKAAVQGYPEGEARLGNAYWSGEGVQQDDDQAVLWLRKAAEQGNGFAQSRLGVAYQTGRGVPQDYAQAVSWYRKAAEKGVTDAQFMLGYAYQFAKGVPQDYAQASKWFRKAAVQGFSGGQTMLGNNYEYGNGVPQDYVLAYAWLNLGASQGDESARSARDSVAEKLTSSELAEAQRLSSRWKSGKGIERESNR